MTSSSEHIIIAANDALTNYCRTKFSNPQDMRAARDSVAGLLVEAGVDIRSADSPQGRLLAGATVLNHYGLQQR